MKHLELDGDLVDEIGIDFGVQAMVVDKLDLDSVDDTALKKSGTMYWTDYFSWVSLLILMRLCCILSYSILLIII